MSLRDVVVLGGGPAGLAAAAAVAPHADAVHVLERDSPQAAAARTRRGVPQSGQLHNLLERGQRELDSLFPGIADALIAGGGVQSRVGRDVVIFDFGRRLPQRDVGLSILSIARPALEAALRSELRRDHPNVHLKEDCSVVQMSGPLWRVDATDGDRGPLRLHADLVIDARGASSWDRPLEAEAPAEISLPLDRWYSSTLVERRRGAGFAMCFPTSCNSKGALLSPAGSDYWHVSVSGTSDDPPVRRSEELVRHLASLEDDHILRTLEGCALEEPFSLFRRRQARRVVPSRRTCTAPLRVGDAQALLSPLAGLGLSQAFAHAGAIRSACSSAHLSGRPTADAIDDAATQIARISAASWELSLLRDRPLVSALMHATGASKGLAREVVATMIDHDPDVHRLDSELWHLLTPIEQSVTTELIARGCAMLEALTSE